MNAFESPDLGFERRDVAVVRWAEACPVEMVNDALAIEEPLEIRVRGRSIGVTMRTPGHDAELAAGFLLSEGLIRSTSDIVRIEPCGRNDLGNILNVVLAPEVHVDFDRLTRHVFVSSSCGICGKATIDAVRSHFAKVEGGLHVESRIISAMPAAMQAAQFLFGKTGGIHASALFTADGRLIVAREDVGRHNAVDKVIGHALLNALLPLNRHVLLVSGRTSFEILQKALSAGTAIVAAVSAPSSLAVAFAEKSGQTLIGFLAMGG